MQEKQEAFNRLLIIMDELREKCPWDKKQTIESIRHLTIEETYELSDAIMEGDMEKIKKELGDLLLHIIFYARIASETKAFNITDIITSLCEKLIHRHPHIYGNVKVENEEQVKQNWEKLKLLEKSKERKEENKSVLSGVPASMPALVKAIRIQEKARAVGFDWEKPEQVWGKVEEEINELHEEVKKVSKVKKEDKVGKVEDVLGDVLFALVNYARFIGVNAEDALEKTNRKFIKRFQYLETEAKKSGKELDKMTLAEMDVYWNEAKKL